MNLSPSEIDALGIVAQEKTDRELAVLDREYEEWKKGPAGRAARLRDADPTAYTPASNTGGKVLDVAARLVLEDGQVLEIPARRGWGGDAAMLDWISVTMHEDSLKVRSQPVTDYEVAVEASWVLEQIFGFGITEKKPHGMNFFETCYMLGDQCGFFLQGRKGNRVQFFLSGRGCAAAKEGWEKRLYDFVCGAVEARITRVDLAFDDYDGNRTVDDAAQWYDDGLYASGGRHPTCEQLGNWKRPDGKGRTFTVGKLKNGKELCCYEKGKQLGDKNSLWVRFEGRMSDVSRIIPFDILLQPGAYLAAMYPSLGWIQEEQKRIQTTQKTAKISYAKTLEWMKVQCGAALWAISEVEGSIEEAFKKIIRVGKIPKRLNMPDWRTCGKYIHDLKADILPAELAIDMSFS